MQPTGDLTKSEKFENAALFLRLGLPSTLIRHENGAFRKRSSNRRNLKTPALCLRVDGKHFENGAFRKRWRYDTHVISLTEPPDRVFLKHKSKLLMTGDCCVSSFRQSNVFGGICPVRFPHP